MHNEINKAMDRLHFALAVIKYIDDVKQDCDDEGVSPDLELSYALSLADELRDQYISEAVTGMKHFD